MIGNIYLQRTGIGNPTRPRLQVVEESLSGALGGASLTMSDERVRGTDTSLGNTTVDQLLHGVTRGNGGQSIGEGSNHAHSHGLVVVSRSVGTLTIPTPALVGTAISTDAPIVANIGPSIAVDMEVLDVTHLSGAGSLGGASSSSGVVNHDEGSRAVGQHR